MNRITACAAVLALATLLPCDAQATPITYELSSVASGKIGATTFTNASVDLIGIGDTSGITALFSGQIFGNPFSSFTVTIGGVGTATITDASELWAIPVAIGSLTAPTILFGRIDAPPALNSITGIGILSSNVLAGYEGAGAIPPTTDAGGIGFPTLCGTVGHDPCINTSLGVLSFTSNFSIPPTGEATFTANPVPEPTTLLLLGSGVAAFVGRSRFQTRRSSRK